MMDAMLQLSAVTMKTVQWLQSAHNRKEYQSAKVMSVIVLRYNRRGGGGGVFLLFSYLVRRGGM